MSESIARWACPCGYASAHALRIDGPLQCPRCDRPLDRQATVGQATVREGGPGNLADRLDELWHQLQRDERGMPTFWFVYFWVLTILLLCAMWGAVVVMYA